MALTTIVFLQLQPMNKPATLRDRLGLLVEDAAPRASIEQLHEEFRGWKETSKFRALPLFDSLALDLALFWHKYFLATLSVGVIVAAVGVWIGLTTIAPGTAHTIPAQTSPAQLSSVSVSRFHDGIAAPSVRFHNVSTFVLTPAQENKSYRIATSHLSDFSIMLQEEHQCAAVTPRILTVTIPSDHFIPVSIGVQPLHFSDPPLDYSGVMASVSYEQSSIPANTEFAATNENDLNYEAGYCFDKYQEAGIGYSRHTYREVSSIIQAITVVNANGTFVYHQTNWHDSDNPISLPGIYYTFHASNLEILGVEPYATAFASKPSAGFLWRASAGLEWNAWDNMNAVFTYSREQLNSAAYPAPENARNFLSFGISYRLLP
jgi:hypothetical protein